MIEPDIEEALRLLRHFREIQNREARQVILKIAEAAARGEVVRQEFPKPKRHD
jgi:hypothetical protein